MSDQTAPLRAVLFDHDGTLVDSEPVHYRIWAVVQGVEAVLERVLSTTRLIR